MVSYIDYSIKLRIVRIQITESTSENIITNLPEDITVIDLKRIYRMRWGIETSFRNLKYSIGAVDFHSKKEVQFIKNYGQDYFFSTFCSPISSYVILDKRTTKHTYQVNFALVIKLCHQILSWNNGKELPDIIGLIGSFTLPIRQGRHYNRP